MTYREARAEFEREYWQGLLRETSGNVTAAAKIAGVYRTHVHKILKDLRIENAVRQAHRGNWCGL